MVSIVSGNSLGLNLSSLAALGQQGSLGNAAQGRSGEQVFVNADTGNLVIQERDDILIGTGLGLATVRTYNSQGKLNDDNADNWAVVGYRSQMVLFGTLNAVGSTLTRTAQDGAEGLYIWNAGASKYVSTAGSGAYDTIVASGAGANAQYIWTDGDTGLIERYNQATGRLESRSDTSGNTVTYAYNAQGNLASMSSASGEATYFDYSGVNLTQIRTVNAASATQTRTRYGYDASNRLSTVTVDLTPEDNAIADGKTYVTTYTYDGTSNRVASITQSDGSSISFAYTLINGDYRVTRMTDGLGRITNYAYVGTVATGVTTTVTDALGNVTTLTSDASGQLTNITGPAVNGVSQSITYTYNANGDVTTSTDARGFVTTYTYDASGNQTQSQDAAGNTVGRTYGSKNELLTSTVYFSPDPDGAGAGVATAPATSRFAYDANNRLRFSVSAEGRVSEFRYNSAGQRVASIGYSANLYPVAGLAVTASITEAALGTWVASAGVDKTRTMRTDTSYDFRGQVDKVTRYQSADATGAGIITNASTTQYVYDQAGNLLQTIAPKGVATTGIATDFITQYSYDGLTRQIRTVDSLGVLTLTQYDDANNKTSTTLANGLVTTKSYNKAGDLISTVQSDGATALGTSTYTYDAAGRLKRVTDATGVANYLLYDAAGRKVADMQADGSLTEYVYNANNQVVKTIQYATAVSAANRTLLINDITAGTNTVTLATIKPATNAADRTSWAIYDKANRLAKTVDELGFVTETQYNGASQVVATLRYNTALTAANRAALTIASLPSDAATTAVANANDRKTRNFFDKDGKQVATLDAAGYLTENQYDAAGRLIHSIAYATQSASAHWASGTLAQLRPIASANDIHNWVLYNAENQVIASVDGEGYLTENTYYLNGNKTQTTRYANKALIAPQSITAGTLIGDLRPGANAQDQTTSWTYTDLNQLKTETNYQGTITQFTYDNVGNLTKTDKAWGTAEVRTLQAKYDKLGRLIAELSGEGSVALAALVSPTQAQINTLWSQYGLAHAYDAAGRRVSTTDAVGNKTRFYYNTDGNLTHSVNALGEVTQSKYNALNQVTQTIAYGTRIATTTLATLNGGLVTTALTTAVTAITNAALDSKTTYSYTLRGQVASTTTAVTGTTSAYNAFSETSSTTQKINATTTVVRSYTYDKRGQLSQTVQDASGINAITSAIYDAFGRMTSSTDANGKVRSQTYDRLGQVISTLDPINAARSSSFDAFGRVLTQTDALGNITRYTYDKATRSVTITTPEGISVSTISTRLGQTQSVTDGRGNTSSYAYDKNGSLLSATTALTSTSQAYDRANRLVQTTDANGNQVVLTYDAANRVLSRTVDPISLNPTGLNLVTTYAYDAKGQLLTVTDPNTVVTQTTYDLKGQVTQVAVDPAGLNLRTQYTYDPRGKTLTVVEGVGSPEVRTTQYVYDKLGRRTSEIVDPTTTTPAYTGLNLTTSYTYDKNDNVITRTDANGNVTRDVYDDNNRLVFTLDPLGGVTQNSYDTEGRHIKTQAYATPISLTSPSALPLAPALTDISTRITANANDQITQTVYDRDGRAAFLIDSLNQVIQKKYDGNGNTIQITQYAAPITVPGTLTTSSLTTATAAIANIANDRTNRFVFDAINRPVYGIDALGQVAEKKYDANGNLISTTHYNKAISIVGNPSAASVAAVITTNAADRTARSVYDKANRKVYEVDAEGYATKNVYDALGRVTQTVQYPVAISVVDTDTVATTAVKLPATPPATAIVTTLTYDKAGRLTDLQNGENFITHTNYDAAGNAIDVIEAYGTASAVTTRRNYDKAGRTLDVIQGYSTTDAANTRYQYDGLGNKTAETDPRGIELSEQDTAWALTQRRALGYLDTLTGNGKLAASLTSTERTALSNLYTTRIVYDALGRKSQSIDALGGVTRTVYDSFNNVIKITDPRNSAAYLYYDKLNRQTGYVDPEGYLTVSVFNRFDNKTSVTLYASKALGTWNETTRPVVVATPPGSGPYVLTNTKDAVTAFEYDRLGRTSKMTDAEGNFETYGYDAFANRTSWRNKVGGDYSYTFDRRGLMLREVLPVTTKNSGGTVIAVANRYVYDAFGNRTQSVEADGAVEQRTTDVTFDRLNRQITKRWQALTTYDTVNGQRSGIIPTETQSYDARGNVIATVNANGARTAYYYDALNRKVGDVSAVGTLSMWIYDKSNNAVTRCIYGDPVALPADTTIPSPVNAANVRTTDFSFDANNRLIQSSTAVAVLYNSTTNTLQDTGATVVTSQTFDANGNVVRSIDARGNSTWSYYNKLGQRLLQIDPLGYGLAWSYDANGSITRERQYASALPEGTLAGLTINNDPAALLSTLAAGAQAADDRITDYTYDRNNRQITQSRLNVAIADVNATTGLLSEKTITVTQTNQYDGLGQITQQTDALGNVTNWTFDSLGRQTHEELASFVDYTGETVRTTTETVHDGLSNVLSQTQKGATLGEDRTTSYQYNTQGMLISQTDAMGNQSLYGVDLLGNITRKQIARLQANGTTATDVLLYGYDGRNQQIYQQDVSTGTTNETQYNVYGQIVAKKSNGLQTEFAEYNSQGQVWRTNAQSGITKAMVYDANGNATLTVESAGANLATMTLAQMLASSDVKPTITVYDARNQVVDVQQPQLTFTHDNPAIQEVQVQSGVSDPFVGGSIAIAAGSVVESEMFGYDAPTEFSPSVASSTITLSLPDSSVRIEVTFQSLYSPLAYTYTSSTRTITLPAIQVGFLYKDYGINYTCGGISIKVSKETAFGNILLATVNRNYPADAENLDYYYGGSISTATPTLLQFRGQPLTASALKLKYRPAGSVGAYTDISVPKYVINGTPVNGWFAHDWSSIPSGNYEYIYEAQDASNKVLNRVAGQFRIDGANSAILSQTAQALDPVYVTQLQWVITGTQNQSNTIHNRQDHNAFGDITAEIDGLGRRSDLTYNTLGKLTRKLDPETDSTNAAGLTSRVRPDTRYYYDRVGRLVGTQDANGYRTTQRYLGANLGQGGNGLVAQEYHADGGSKTTGYDRFGQARTYTDEKGRITRTTYDKNGNLTRIDRPVRGAGEYLAGQSAYDLYSYDSLGQRITHTNALGNVEKWAYDSMGRVTQATSFAARTTAYSYVWNAAQTSLAGVISGGWRKTTTDANGRTLVDSDDVWGRNWSHQDLGGRSFAIAYNAAGWVTQRTGSTGQNIAYTYYDNGFVKTIQDNALNTYTKYEYDAAGNRTFEGYTTILDGQNNREFYQYATISYDELNRVKQIWDPKYQINYQYDTVGNRRRVNSYYHDGANGNATTQDYWYKYDGMNRFTLTKGTFDESEGIVKGSTGVDIEYNTASERTAATYGYDGHREDYQYNADGYLAITSINGITSAVRNNNLVGQLENYVEYTLGTSNIRTNDTTSYDADSKTTRVANNLTGKGSNYSYLADGTLASTSTYGDATTTATTYSYEWWDSAKQSQIQVQASNQAAPGWAPGYSQFQYDVNGNLKQVNDNTGNRALRYVTNGEGLILKRDEIANLSAGGSINKTHYWYYANGRKVGDVGNDGQSREDYAQTLQGDKNVDRKTLYQRFKPANTADFDQNYEPINANYPGGTPGSYTVRTGDTLRSIATSLWGDGSLWYLLADANGLSDNASLTAGTTLVVPNKVSNLHNNSTTFRPYNAGEAIGDTSPTLPDPPPPPVSSGGGCGGMATVLMIVVIAVVTIYTAGAAAAYFLPAGATAAAGGTMALGASVLAGSAGGGMMLAAAAIGGAVGNIAGQGMAMAMGVQKEFSWNQVGMSALAAGMTACIGSYFAPVAGAAGAASAASPWATAGRAALSTGLSQGVGEQLGMGVKFSWTNVAMAAVSSGVNSVVKANTPFNDSRYGLFNDTMNGFASGMTMNALRGGQMTAAQVATDAFGNALGNSIVEGLSKPSQQEDVLGKFIDEKLTAQEQRAQAAMREAAASGLPKTGPYSNLNLDQAREYGFIRSDSDYESTGTTADGSSAMRKVAGGIDVRGGASSFKDQGMSFGSLPGQELTPFQRQLGGGWAKSTWNYLTEDIPALADAKNQTLDMLQGQMEGMTELAMDPNTSFSKRMAAGLTLGSLAHNYGAVSAGTPTSLLDLTLAAFSAAPVVRGLYGEMKLGIRALDESIKLGENTQVTLKAYQRAYDDAAVAFESKLAAKSIVQPEGVHFNTWRGGQIDEAARADMKAFKQVSSMDDLVINKRLYTPDGVKDFRIPDLLVASERTAIDGTIGIKTVNTPQIRDILSSGNVDRVILVSPNQKPVIITVEQYKATLKK